MASFGGFPNMMRVLAHRPFQDELAQRLLWLFGLPSDAVTEKANQGCHGHFVLQAQGDGLAFLGSDRGIVHGLTEDDDSYARRVSRGLDNWQVAGNPWSVLAQVLGYVLNATPRAATVSTVYSSVGVAQSSQWDQFVAGADTSRPPSHSLDATGNFDWDSTSPTMGSWGWHRWYMVLVSTGWIEPDGRWGSGGLWGDGKAWGVDEVREVGLTIKSVIVQQWRPVGKWCHWIILSFNDARYQPGSPAGGGINPEGSFGRWSKLVDGIYQRSRFADALYFMGPTR